MGTYRSPLDDQWGVSETEDEWSGKANAGTGENDVPTTASITHSWSNPSNITAESLSTAELASSGGSYIFPYLRASNFGFDIPSSATVLGVEVDVVWGATSSDYTLDELYLAWGASASTFSTTNKGTGQNLSSTGGDIVTYGGASDMWGESSATLTPTVVNSSDFGIVIKPAKTATDSNSCRVDCVRIAVTYSVTEDGNVRVSQTEALVLYTYEKDVQVTQTYAEVIVSTAIGGASGEGRRQIIVVT